MLNKCELMNTIFCNYEGELPSPPDELLEQVLSTLLPRERFIIERRFDQSPMTLNQVGKELSCSAERVRQIEAKALRRLRHPTRSRKLRGGGNDDGNR